VNVRDAKVADVVAIVAVLEANRGDTSLFQQSEKKVRSKLGDFVVATDDAGAVCGCAALRWHKKDNAEILAVAVLPLHKAAVSGAP
jgi:N-acetylglutamate synthase-like GNAT family acetyltransferase